MNNKNSSNIVFVLLLFTLVLPVFYLSACSNDEVIIMNGENDNLLESDEDGSASSDTDSGTNDNKEIITDNALSESSNDVIKRENVLVVHIGGEVINPGVYSLETGSRLIDAVNAAGGFSKEADTEYENLAAFLEDGAQYIILSKDEAREKRDTAELSFDTTNNFEQSHYDKDGVLNINLASKEEFMKLDGIGESKAEKIIEYRETKGKFKSIEDLKNVSGIGNNIFNSISSSITVD